MKHIVILSLLVTVLLTAFSSCDKADQTREFRVRDTDVTIELAESWQQLDEVEIEEAREQVSNLEQISIYEAAIIGSYSGENQSSIIISSLSSNNSNKKNESNSKEHVQTYITDIEEYFKTSFLTNREENTVNDFEAVFLQMYNDDIFAVKTVYYNSDIVFQIDFIVPRSELTEELLAEIEEALLSVKKL
jgi:hypothetical protein